MLGVKDRQKAMAVTGLKSEVLVPLGYAEGRIQPIMSAYNSTE